MALHALRAGSNHSRVSVLRWLVTWPLVIALVGLGLLAATGPAARAAGTNCATPTAISNGTVTLGVDCLGDLGSNNGSDTGQKGLYYEPTHSEAVSQGCSCEGWGVADQTSGVTGFVDESDAPDGGPGTSANVSLVSFTSTQSTAVSVVDVGSTFQVTQQFHPSAQTPNLYEVDVTVANTSGAATHLRYRRVMDWDIEPTVQHEYVSLDKGTSQRIVFTSDDGFATADPLADQTSLENTGNFVDSGPNDHGALFDFDFGTINAGASRSFKIFYGAADNETHAESALNAVNAEAYSFGQPDFDPTTDDEGNLVNPDQGPTVGAPNTFMFAFKDIDGASLFAPNAATDTFDVHTGASASLDVLANDTDPNHDPLAIEPAQTTSPSHGSVSCTASLCTYTSDPGYVGVDQFNYTITDGSSEATATVVLNVAYNRPPIANDDSLTLDEDNAGPVSVLANDSDPDGDAITVTGHTDPTKGSVTCTTTTCTYTPRPNVNGTDSFDYTISDGQSTATATVRVTIRPVDDAPVAVADTATTNEDTGVAIPVTANDTDIDTPNSGLSAVLATGAAHGTVSCTGGTCTYTPDPNWNGSDSFTYRVSDGTLSSAPVAVNVTVVPVNDAPVALDDNASAITGGAPVDVRVLANDSDVDGDTLSVAGHTSPVHGSVSCTTSVCTYTPDGSYTGADPFDYAVSDGHGGTATATVHVAVSPPNQPPVAVDDQLVTDEDTAKTISVLANDTDVDHDQLSLDTTASTVAPENGSVTCTNAGACTYTPLPDFNGTDSFTYVVTDGHGHTAVGTVDVTVDPVNDNPVPGTDRLTTDRDRAGTVSVLVNDDDVDGDALSVTAAGSSAHGTAQCTTDGICTFTPAKHWAGNTTFTYTVSDGNGGTATGTVQVTVRATVSVPGAPRIGKPKAGVIKVRSKTYNAAITWKAPTWNGGTAITSYRVLAQKVVNGKVVSTITVKAAKKAKSARVRLSAGTWNFRVCAVNAVGKSPLSKTSKSIRIS